jgi:hypothetical protein
MVHAILQHTTPTYSQSQRDVVFYERDAEQEDYYSREDSSDGQFCMDDFVDAGSQQSWDSNGIQFVTLSDVCSSP